MTKHQRQQVLNELAGEQARLTDPLPGALAQLARQHSPRRWTWRETVIPLMAAAALLLFFPLGRAVEAHLTEQTWQPVIDELWTSEPASFTTESLETWTQVQEQWNLSAGSDDQWL